MRGTLAQLNQTIAQNRNALVNATGAERENLQAVQRAKQAQAATIRSMIEQTRLRQQAVTEIQREARSRQRAAEQAVRAAERTRAAQQAALTDLTAGARIVAQQLGRLTGSLVQGAANMETFRNSVQAVTGDANRTNEVLGQLLDLTVELVGIDTGDLISFAGRLMATGLSAEQSITAIRGVTERVAEQGKSAAVTTRVLEQLTQAINSNTITAQDFRPILRELPTLFSDASNALGVNIRSLEDFRNAAEGVGGPVQAIIMLTEEMGRASEGARLDSFNAQMDILRDQAGLLAAELGEHLIPAIVGILQHVNNAIEALRNMDDRGQAVIAWATAFAAGLAGLATIVGTATVAFGALSASLGALTGASGALTGAAGLGRLAGLLAPTGPIVAGVSLFTLAISPLVSALLEMRNETNRLNETQASFATALQGTISVLNNREGIDTQITSLREYREELEETIRAEERRQRRSAQSSGRFTTGGFSPVVENIPESELTQTTRQLIEDVDRLIDFLSDLRNEAGVTTEQIRAFEQELSASLATARNLGQTDTVAVLEATAMRLLEINAELTTNTERTETSARVLRNFRIEAAELNNTLFQAREAFSAADTVEDLESSYQSLEAAIRSAGQVALDEIDAEIAAQGRIIASTEAGSEARVDAQNTLKDLVAERREVELNTEQQIFDARQRYTNQTNSLLDRATQLRIERAERARDVEVAGTEAAAAVGARYAELLSQIASFGDRRAFVSLVEQFQAQGLSLREALEEAERYIPVLDQRIPAAIESTSDSLREFSIASQDAFQASARSVANLTGNIIALGGEIRELIREADQLDRLALSDERADQREADYFRRNPIGRTLDDIRQEAGEQGRRFVGQAFRQSARDAQEFDQIIGEIRDKLNNDIPLAVDEARFALEFFGDLTEETREELELLVDAFDTFGHDGRLSVNQVVSAIGDLGRALEDSNSQISEIGIGLQGLSDLFSNPISFAANTLGAVLAGLADYNQFGGPLGLSADFFTDPVPRPQGYVDPRNIRAVGEQQDFQVHTAGIARYLDTPGGIDIIRQNQPELFHRPGTREFIEQNYPGLVDIIYPRRGRDTATGRFSAFQRVQGYQRGLAFNRTPEEIDAEYLATFAAGDPNAQLPIRGGLEDTPDPAELVDPAIAALDDLRGRTAFGDLLEGLVESLILTATSDQQLGDAIQSIISDPAVQAEYDRRVALIGGENGIIDTAEERLAFENSPLFGGVESWITGVIQPSVDATQMGIDALNNIQATNAFNDTLQGLVEGFVLTSTSEADLESAIQTIISDPAVQAEYDRRVRLIGGEDGFINTAGELAAYQDSPLFGGVASWVRGIIQPSTDATQMGIDSLANVRANSAFNDALDELVGGFVLTATTDADLAAAIETIIADPRIIAEYNRRVMLIGGEDGIINTAAEQAAFESSPLAGGVGSWITGIIQPSTDATQMGIDSLNNFRAGEAFNDILETLVSGLVLTATTDADLESAIGTIITNPAVQAEYNRRVALMGGEDGIVNTAAEQLAFEQSPLAGGVESWITSIIEPSTDATQMGIDSLQNFRANKAFNDILEGLIQGLILTATTETNLESAIQTIIADPRVAAEYNRRVMLMGGEDGVINTAAEIQAFENSPLAGGVEAWITGLINPSAMATQSGIDALNNFRASNTFNNTLEGLIQGLILPAMTDAELESAIQSIITNPAVIAEYNRRVMLIGGEDGIVNTVSEQLAFEQSPLAGGVESWIRGEIQPSVSATQMGIDALGTLTSGNAFNDTLETLLDGLLMNSSSEAELTAGIQALITNPDIIEEYNRRRRLAGGIDEVINTAGEQAEAIGLGVGGSVEDFVTSLLPDNFVEGFNTGQSRNLRSRQGTARRQDRSSVRQARFNLGGATSEQDFNNLFTPLITAINTFYDNEEERIRALGLGIEETNRLIAENDQSRREEIRSATAITNTFAQERIRSEMRVADEIADIRDQQVENEQDRLQRLADLQEDHNARIVSLQEQLQEDLADLDRERYNESLDIHQEYQRDLQDLQTRFAREIFGDDVISVGDLTDAQRRQLESNTEYQRDLFDLNRGRDRGQQDFQREFGILTPGGPGEQFYREQIESGAIEITDQNAASLAYTLGSRLFESVLSNQRATEDAETRRTRAEADINAQAQATALALGQQIEPLLERQTSTAELESETAEKQASTATTQSATATTESSTAMLKSENVSNESAAISRTSDLLTREETLQENQASNIEMFGTATERWNEVAETLDASVDTLVESFSGLEQSAEIFAVGAERLAGAVGRFIFGSGVSALETAPASARTLTPEPEPLQPIYVDSPNRRGNRNLDDSEGSGVRSSESGQTAGGGQGTVVIQNNLRVDLDGRQVAEGLDESLVELDEEGRAVGSYRKREDD